MRSRYSAYAVGNFDYLVKSLAPTHEDLSQGTDTLKAILRQSSAGVRYMGLRIVGTEAENAEGDSYVLFVARMFERGKNCSLVELARFRRFDGAFRYVDGDARPFKAAAWEAPHAPLSLSSYRASQASG
jgi:SEC-C motif-containing protein